MKPLIYVAGPYTRPDPVENTHKAIRVAEWLELEYDCGVVIPHLSLAWHLVSPAPLEVWYQRDLHVLERCDALYRFPGESTGADREVEHALKHGLEIFIRYDGAPTTTTLDTRIRRWRDQWSRSR